MGKTSVSLHYIENINSIQQLAPYYTVISNHAKVITGLDDYEDLVHDLFIKLDNYFKKYPDKVINGGFISNSIRNMLRNIHKANTRSKIDQNVEVETTTLFTNVEDCIIEDKIADEMKYDEIETMMDDLTWVEKTVLEYSLIMSLSEISRLSDIPYQNLVYALNCAKKKLGIKKLK